MTFKVVRLFIIYFCPEIKKKWHVGFFGGEGMAFKNKLFSFFFFFREVDGQRITIFKIVALCFSIGLET